MVTSIITIFVNMKNILCSKVSIISLKQVYINLLLLKTNQSLIEESTNTSGIYRGISFCYDLNCYTLINLK
jgi:hypothetical protein